MNITLTLPDFANPLAAMWWLFSHGGFVAVLIAIGYGIWWLYMDAIQNRWLAKQRFVLLAVDVPRENEQTPKAVEHIFSHFHGIQKNPNAKEKYIEGYVQLPITVELVSIDGYIQYLVRTPVDHRDLVEAAIYAQYPQAEISEVEDYAFKIPAKYPDPEWDLWAAELELTNKDAYPIRTYPLWEHSLTQTFLDPMASLLEIMSRLRPGEQLWMQWICKPLGDNTWRKKGIEIINKLVGIKSKSKKSALESLAEAPGALLTGTYETIVRTLYEPSDSSAKKQKDEPPSLMQHIPPHLRVVVEAIGMKISKLGFDVKARVVYTGKKEVFDKSRISGVMGAMKQFASMDMNGFKPDKKMKTKVDYWRVKQRVAALQRRLVLGYRNRSTWSGRTTFVLNIEELASVWHFPVITVKAPLVKKTEAKRGEPPTLLPVGELDRYQPKTQPAPVETVANRGAAPTNLPIG